MFQPLFLYIVDKLSVFSGSLTLGQHQKAGVFTLADEVGRKKRVEVVSFTVVRPLAQCTNGDLEQRKRETKLLRIHIS